MFLLVPAHPVCPGQNPESCKTVVFVCVVLMVKLLERHSAYKEFWFGSYGPEKSVET